MTNNIEKDVRIESETFFYEMVIFKMAVKAPAHLNNQEKFNKCSKAWKQIRNFTAQ